MLFLCLWLCSAGNNPASLSDTANRSRAAVLSRMADTQSHAWERGHCMKSLKYVSLSLSLVFLFMAAISDNATFQLILSVCMFLFFQVWLRLIKKGHRENSRSNHSG